MTHTPGAQLADKILDLLGWPGRVYFSSSGSEANEVAFKVARQYHLQSGKPGGATRYKIIARHRAYHGNTLGAMSATGQAERKIGYGPMAPGFIHVPPPYPYRAHPKLTPAEHGIACARRRSRRNDHLRGARDGRRGLDGADHLRRRRARAAGRIPAARARNLRRVRAYCSSSTKSSPATAAPAKCSATTTGT